MRAINERRGYVVLVGISVVLSILTILFCAKVVSGANDRTCDIIQVALQFPPPKPIGKADTPLAHTLYNRYLAYVQLFQELKCQSLPR